ncbi:hypothetical protein PVAP13_2NG039300 [Panicum virgatum]|uniref:Uncharacterized protein n=1 Tax=Panicum virgatum TaxID=38727 RepID=A0A8T0VED5_PANVG|nr:hypothetical protein PVAP13_2NG039300 [Panicum virgatum]
MAMRSLAVMLKALPRRVPGSGAFAKVNPWSTSSARLSDRAKCGSVKETAEQLMKRTEEKRQKYGRDYTRATVLGGIIGSAYLASVLSRLSKLLDA